MRRPNLTRLRVVARLLLRALAALLSRPTIDVVLELGGAGLVVYGLAQWSTPVALVVAGLLLVAYANRPSTNRPSPD